MKNDGRPVGTRTPDLYRVRPAPDRNIFTKHGLRRELNLWDLVLLQMVLVFLLGWIGTTVKQGGDGNHSEAGVGELSMRFVPGKREGQRPTTR